MNSLNTSAKAKVSDKGIKYNDQGHVLKPFEEGLKKSNEFVIYKINII